MYFSLPILSIVDEVYSYDIKIIFIPLRILPAYCPFQNISIYHIYNFQTFKFTFSSYFVVYISLGVSSNSIGLPSTQVFIIVLILFDSLVLI